MKQAKGTLVGQRGLRLVYATFLPDDAPKATVLLVHGYGEHSGRYRHVVESFVARDYAVYIVDHRGHGESQGRRAQVERFEYFVDDLRLLAGKARAAFPDLPRFVVGHSLGGLIAFHYAARHQSELSGLVLSGPALLSDAAPLLQRVVRLLGPTLPWLPVAPLATGPESALSRDPEIQRLFDADPLTYRAKMKAGMGYQLLRGIKLAEPLMSELTLPLLIVQGEADRIVNPEGARRLYAAARSVDKTIKLYPDCRHEIFNELIKDEALELVGSWLDRHLIAPASEPVSEPAAVATA